MQVITKNDIITHQVLNKDTGELESKDFKEVKQVKNIKGGFNLMYHKSYEEITEQALKSSTDIKVFNWITNRFTYQRVETPIVFSECPVEVSKPQFTRLVKRLVELNYLHRVCRGIYRLNPFIYVPFRADGSELQIEWSELLENKDESS